MTRLGFLSVCTFASSSPPHFSLMSLVRISISFLLLVSICTLPFFSVLRELIPTLISVGLILDFSMSLITLEVALSFYVTMSV